MKASIWCGRAAPSTVCCAVAVFGVLACSLLGQPCFANAQALMPVEPEGRGATRSFSDGHAQRYYELRHDRSLHVHAQGPGTLTLHVLGYYSRRRPRATVCVTLDGKRHATLRLPCTRSAKAPIKGAPRTCERQSREIRIPVGNHRIGLRLKTDRPSAAVHPSFLPDPTLELSLVPLPVPSRASSPKRKSVPIRASSPPNRRHHTLGSVGQSHDRKERANAQPPQERAKGTLLAAAAAIDPGAMAAEQAREHSSSPIQGRIAGFSPWDATWGTTIGVGAGALLGAGYLSRRADRRFERSAVKGLDGPSQKRARELHRQGRSLNRVSSVLAAAGGALVALGAFGIMFGLGDEDGETESTVDVHIGTTRVLLEVAF